MTFQRNKIHPDRVQAWLDKNARDLSVERLVQLFAAAIHAVEERSLVTLSRVTVEVVIDRALFVSREKFPILMAVSIDRARLDLRGLLGIGGELSSEKMRDALSFLLTETLSVFGNITADVLTEPLHKELVKVTAPENRDES